MPLESPSNCLSWDTASDQQGLFKVYLEIKLKPSNTCINDLNCLCINYSILVLLKPFFFFKLMRLILKVIGKLDLI